MSNWRKQYLTYAKLNYQQALEIIANTRYEDSQDQAAVSASLSDAHIIVDKALRGQAFKSDIDTREGHFGELKSIDGASFIKWSIKADLLSREFLEIINKEDEKVQLDPEMPVTLRAVIEIWNDKKGDLSSLTQEKLGELVKERYSEIKGKKLEGCAHVLQGTSTPGVRRGKTR
jgi:hypothetical protein